MSFAIHTLAGKDVRLYYTEKSQKQILINPNGVQYSKAEHRFYTVATSSLLPSRVTFSKKPTNEERKRWLFVNNSFLYSCSRKTK